MAAGRTKDETGVPGEDASRPGEIPKKGWLQVAKRGWAEAKTDQVPLLGAGVAFFAFLSLFPALIALVGLYGLFADPAVIATQVGSLTQALPADARTLITDQITSLTSGGRQGLGVSVVISILVALWSASGGVSNLITAVNTAYDEDDDRNFFKKRGLALLLTLGAMVFLVLVLGLLAVVPPLLESVLGDSPVVRILLLGARWVLLVVIIAAALAVLYRVAPDRDAPQMRWVSVGAVVATVIWLLASIGFSVYVSTFGNYAKTYGVFAGIIVLLLWLWITSYAVLLGAEINAESEEQTGRDTTKGPEQPIGQRDAVKADSTPGTGDR
ncbi:YihY/virulence factor BrkB family protein [Auraticoccus monumenti]|uniref:Membrane protein n=1 Tax=Auraticoccus monumenti TaxID=675864 RepID=A0A1G6YYE5_9ACTN|nr:YihY/virulence factor BrkB family protein [Auraticoccus monumenti]SDD95282.1 membrane protein [Auraticoccus monumenti]